MDNYVFLKVLMLLFHPVTAIMHSFELKIDKNGSNRSMQTF